MRRGEQRQAISSSVLRSREAVVQHIVTVELCGDSGATPQSTSQVSDETVLLVIPHLLRSEEREREGLVEEPSTADLVRLIQRRRVELWLLHQRPEPSDFVAILVGLARLTNVYVAVELRRTLAKTSERPPVESRRQGLCN